MSSKTCRECRRRLPMESFSKDRQAKDGRRNICCICAKAEFSNHKAIKTGNGGTLTGLEILNLLEEQNHICYYAGDNNPSCQTNLTLDNLVIDHVHPFAKGGMNVISNIVCSCNTCNNRKFTMPVDVAMKVLNSGGQLKWCGECKRILPISKFRKTSSQKFGREGYCVKCKNRRKRAITRKQNDSKRRLEKLLRGHP